ncbi:N-acetylmuramoyl-L-alanine amidase CwlD [Clostridium acidisoli]|nr:N-acetylmuramoyl-L-alanine amidase CwlD [Clostridium acidisoli]
MKKFAGKLIILIVLIFISSNVIINAEELKKDDKKIILIDPGHGGIDGGAESKNGITEKDINLKIGLNLKKRLEKQHFKVVMTRDKDKGLYSDEGKIRKKKLEDLNNRCKMKEESNCDMFVSIHLNKFPQSKYYGAQVWYSDNKNSTELAHIIQENLREDLNDDSGRVEKPALELYKVLRCSKNIPSVIVECGFLSNEEEAYKLNTDKYQNKIAESICKSIKMYYDKKS